MKEILDLTQLVGKDEMFTRGFCGAGVIAWAANELFECRSIIDRRTGKLIEKPNLVYLAIGVRQPDGTRHVAETVTAWKEWQDDGDQEEYDAIRYSRGILKPEECLHSGSEVCDDDDGEGAIAANLMEQIIWDMAVRCRGAAANFKPINYQDYQIFRVTKPYIGEKWVWSEYQI